MLGCVYSHLLSVGKDQRVHSACFRPCHHRVFALTGSEVSLCHWAQTQPQHPEPTGRVEQARSRRQSPREVQVSVSLTSEVWREDWYICFSKRTFKLSEINLEKPFGLACVLCQWVYSVQWRYTARCDIRLRVRGSVHGPPPPVSTDAVTCDSVGSLRHWLDSSFYVLSFFVFFCR